MSINIINLLTCFIIYSFLGWVMESVFRSVCERKIINTGFLRGPFCPIYGIGSIIMILLLERFKNLPILLFFISVIILTAWEYIVGIILEKMFNTRYWDYSDHRFNFQGRICLTNSIYWGVLGVLFIEYINPFVQSIISKVNSELLNYILAILFMIFLVDMIGTIINIKNMNITLQKIENINKEIKEKLKEIKTLRKEKGPKHVTTQNIQNIVDNLKKKRNKTILRLYKNVYRLKKAFPAINTKEITQILNQKIELRKKRIKNK